MTLQPPHPNVQLRVGEHPTPERLAQVLDAIQQNFDFYNQLFPLRNSELGTKIARGAVEVEWGGASAFSNEKKVTHGLGKTPTAVVATVRGEKVFGVVTARALTSTQFTIFVAGPNFETPAAGTKETVFWIAVV